MTRMCVYCPVHHAFGEVEPLADRRLTHGMCPEAAKRENDRLDAALAARPAAPLFFTRDIVDLSRPHDGNATGERRP